eukprot:15462824-Alexandrium_andersonii.AAC.1
MGSPLPATMLGLKTLALRTASNRAGTQDLGLKTLALRTSKTLALRTARRWHGVVPFGSARQLHASTMGTSEQRLVESVLPDWADGPPVGLALDHYAQVLGPAEVRERGR